MNVKDLRKKYGLTQKELHEITGIPLRTIQSWELSERGLSEYLYNLLEFFLKHRQKNENLKGKKENTK